MPKIGVEPTTFTLQKCCSAIELLRLMRDFITGKSNKKTAYFVLTACISTRRGLRYLSPQKCHFSLLSRGLHCPSQIFEKDLATKKTLLNLLFYVVTNFLRLLVYRIYLFFQITSPLYQNQGFLIVISSSKFLITLELTKVYLCLNRSV